MILVWRDYKHRLLFQACLAALTYECALGGCFLLSGYLALREKLPTMLTEGFALNNLCDKTFAYELSHYFVFDEQGDRPCN